MNASQLKYARERAGVIYKNRQRAIREQYTAAAVVLDMPGRLEALRDGAFTVDLEYTGHYLHGAIRFDAEIPHDVKGQEAALAQLAKEYEVLIDELVLGDNEKALALLAAFGQASC